MLVFIVVQLLMMIFDPDVEIDQSSIEVVCHRDAETELRLRQEIRVKYYANNCDIQVFHRGYVQNQECTSTKGVPRGQKRTFHPQILSHTNSSCVLLPLEVLGI